MEAFFVWLRKRFTMVDLVHLADIEDETLKSMTMEDGPSRNAFIKFIVYKLLLDIDSELENSIEHNLEKIFVTFGLLDKESAQQFLKGSMTTNVHIDTWKKIIEVLIPTTTISPEWPSYDELINHIHEKNSYFTSIANKNFLPPELISKLKVESVKDGDCENLEVIANELVNIMKNPIKSNVKNDGESLSYSEEQSLSCLDSELMNLNLAKSEIDQYIKISNENTIKLTNNLQTTKMSPQELAKLTIKQNLTQTEYLESKVHGIIKLVKAEHDLQMLANSVADEVVKAEHDLQMVANSVTDKV